MSPRLLLVAALALFSASATGCAYRSFDHVDTAFRASANARSQYMPVTDAAREYGGDDADTLNRIGGMYLGELELKGVREGTGNHEGPRSAVMLKRAAREAASVGATHFMLVRDDARTETDRQSGYAYGAKGTQFVETESKKQIVVAHYALIRVEPALIAQLPPELRPTLLPAKPSSSVATR